jgi:hypothetical protein
MGAQEREGKEAIMSSLKSFKNLAEHIKNAKVGNATKKTNVTPK